MQTSSSSSSKALSPQHLALLNPNYNTGGGGSMVSRATYDPANDRDTLNNNPFRRTVSSVGYMLGVPENQQEAWTNDVLETLEKANNNKPAGGFPMPAAFANKKDFWVTLFLTAFASIFLGLLALCYLNFVTYLPKQWTDNFSATETSNYFTCNSQCSPNLDDFIAQTSQDPLVPYVDPCESCDKINNYEFYKGKTHWIAVPVIGGFLISLLRYFGNFPDTIPGLYEELNKAHVDYKLSPLTFIISAISLGFGATLGPELGMANFGGGLMCYLEGIFGAKFIEDEEYKKLFILGGFAAVFGALFPTPMLAVLIVFELCDPPKQYMAALLIMFAGAVPAWLVYYAVERYTFIEYLKTDSRILSFQWDFSERNCATGFLIGIMGAIIGLMSALFIGISRRIFGVIKLRMMQRQKKYLSIALPLLISGAAIGAVNWALPMTVGYGDLLLPNLIHYGNQNKFSNKLLLCSVFGRHFLLGMSMSGGWIGGFILPSFTIGTLWGVIAYQTYAAAPYGLYISCFMASITCTMSPTPMTFTLLPCFVFFFGLYQTVPIFIAAVTTYLLLAGTGILEKLTNSNQTQGVKDAGAASASFPRASELVRVQNTQTSNEEYEQSLYKGKPDKASPNYEPPNA